MQTIPIIFRCDATPETGLGHFRRCYALAEVAQQSSRFRVYFLTRPLSKALKKKLAEIHASVQILDQAATLEQDLKAVHGLFDMMSRKKIIVCVDQKDWTAECYDSVKKDERVVLVAFDDGDKRHYTADFLINPALDADDIAYSSVESCERLLGPKYTMVRDEVHTLRQHPTERMAENFQFLCYLGVGDRWGHSLKVVEAAKASPIKFETHLVVNQGWPHTEAAKRIIGNHPRLHFYEDPSFFPQLLARADLALTSASSTVYELAYLGIPMMTVSLTAQQQNMGEAWARRGLSEHLGSADQMSAELIMEKIHYWMERDQELEERGVATQKIVDGRGKFRVLERVSKLILDKSA